MSKCRKIPFETSYEAQQYIKKIKEDVKGKLGVSDKWLKKKKFKRPRTSYLCPHCGRFHMTSQPREVWKEKIEKKVQHRVSVEAEYWIDKLGIRNEFK